MCKKDETTCCTNTGVITDIVMNMLENMLSYVHKVPIDNISMYNLIINAQTMQKLNIVLNLECHMIHYDNIEFNLKLNSDLKLDTIEQKV